VRDGDRIWITPTRVLSSQLHAGDVCAVALDGTPLAGGHPSIELPLHLELYSRDPRAGSVVHTHSPWATAWSHRCRDLDLPTEELEYHGIRRIRCSSRAPAGSRLLAMHAIDALQDAPVALLGGHGVVATGVDVDAALSWAELAEQQAHLEWLLRLDWLLGSFVSAPG
jgi:L-fuculose-phosphate aldolase